MQNNFEAAALMMNKKHNTFLKKISYGIVMTAIKSNPKVSRECYTGDFMKKVLPATCVN